MKIAIDYGHCLKGADTGAQGNGLKEQNITREVGRKVTAKLKALGHTAIEVAPDSANSVGESLAHRVNKANNNNVDLFVSIHVNAGGGLGTEIYTYGAKHFAEARNVLNNIRALGFRDRGIKNGSNLYVIKNTKAPAMLIEMFFIDTEDVALYRKIGAESMASAIVKGITGSNAITGSKAIPSKPTPPTWEYYISGDIIKRLQRELNRQFGAGLVVDGYCGNKTLSKLITVRIKARGEITKIIQELLIRKGYSVGRYGADGVFGNSTYNAVVNFQYAQGLTTDGVVGINTWKALLKK